MLSRDEREYYLDILAGNEKLILILILFYAMTVIFDHVCWFTWFVMPRMPPEICYTYNEEA